MFHSNLTICYSWFFINTHIFTFCRSELDSRIYITSVTFPHYKEQVCPTSGPRSPIRTNLDQLGQVEIKISSRLGSEAYI